MALVSSEKLVPAQLVEHLLGVAPQDLEEAQPLGPLVLLVSPPEDDEGEFVSELERAILAGSPSVPEGAVWLSTSEFPALRRSSIEPVEFDLVELIAALGSSTHAVVPLLFPHPQAELLLGRSSEADIRLPHPGVSAKHATLRRQGPSVKLTDLGSKNGTRVNGRLLKPKEELWLQPMDRVTFGRVNSFVCDPRALRAVLVQGLQPIA